MMKHRFLHRLAISSATFFLLPVLVYAQGTLADYERAQTLRKQFEGLTLNLPGRTNWIEKTNRFWYRKSVKGGNEFVLVDAETLAKDPAFDHDKLAASLSAATGEKYKAVVLPLTTFTFVDNQRAITFIAGDSRWRCDISNYTCNKIGPADRFGVAAVHLAVGEGLQARVGEPDAELGGDLAAEVAAGPAGDDHQPLVVAHLEDVGRRPCLQAERTHDWDSSFTRLV